MSTDPAGAEDLVQETYARAWGGFATQGRGEVRPWLVAICLNVGRGDLRRHLRLRRRLRLPRVVAGLDTVEETPDTHDVSRRRAGLGRAGGGGVGAG